ARAERILTRKTNGLDSLGNGAFGVFAWDACKLLKDKFGTRQFAFQRVFTGRVGEWLKPADCTCAAPCGLRRVESFPVHQVRAVRVAENRRAIASSDVRKRSDWGRRPNCGRNGKKDAAPEKCAAKDDF